MVWAVRRVLTMKQKEFDILLDIRKPSKDHSIEVVQGDNNANVLNINLIDGYEPFDLTGTSVDIIFKKTDGTTVQQSTTFDPPSVAVVNEKQGKIQCILKTNTIACPGPVVAEVKVMEDDGLLTSARFGFYVRESLLNDKTVESTNEFPVLQNLINSVEGVVEAVPAIEERLDEINDLESGLNQAIQNGNTLKADLDDSISAAATVKNDLDTSIVAGEGIREDLENIISGTDFEQVITDLKDVKEKVEVKAQYTDLDSQTGTFIHTEKSEDSVAEIVKIEGKTVVTPANPDEDISPDNVAEIKSAGPCDVVSCNKNLFDKSISAKGWYGSDGEFRTSSVWYIREIPVKPNTDITFSGIVYDADSHICGRKSDGAIIPIAPVDNRTINTSDYVSIIYSIHQNYLDSAQLEIGSTPTDYTSHQSDKITLDMPLRDLPDGVKDELIYLGGGKAKYIQRIDKAILTGDEDNWRIRTDLELTNTVYFEGGSLNRLVDNITKRDLICDKFKSHKIFDNDIEGVVSYNTRAGFRILKSRLTTLDVAGFRQWLSENPVTIYYELAEPIETIIDTPTLKSYSGITNIYTTSEIQPAMTVNFKSRLWNDMRNKADLIDGKIPENQLPDTVAEGISELNRTIENISKFETAGGTGTDITLTGVEFINGYGKTFIVSADNDGLPTTINGKPLYKPGTTQTPNLKTGKAVTVWYDEGNDCFFIKASAEGDAVAGDVLAGKTFSNDNDTGITGTMPNNGAINHSLPINGSYTIPKGYHDGNGKVTQDIPTKEAQVYIPSTTDQVIAGGQYLAGDQVIKGDANLIPENIPEDLMLFGIQGTRALGKRFASGSITMTLVDGLVNMSAWNGTDLATRSFSHKSFRGYVTNIGFIPSLVRVWIDDPKSSQSYNLEVLIHKNFGKGLVTQVSKNSAESYGAGLNGSSINTSTGEVTVYLPARDSTEDRIAYWEAWE